jgi:hypothetical protein
VETLTHSLRCGTNLQAPFLDIDVAIKRIDIPINDMQQVGFWRFLVIRGNSADCFVEYLAEFHQTILSPEAIFIARIRGHERHVAAVFGGNQEHVRIRGD